MDAKDNDPVQAKFLTSLMKKPLIMLVFCMRNKDVVVIVVVVSVVTEITNYC